MPSIGSYSKTAAERTVAKKITLWQAAEILGFSNRHSRVRERYEHYGYGCLFDNRRASLRCRFDGYR